MDDLTIEEKAQLFDNIMNCERIRVLGTARDGIVVGEGNITHIGIELWTKYPLTDETRPEADRHRKVFLENIKVLVAR